MTIQETSIKGLLIIKPRVFTDERGYFFESYNMKSFKDLGIDDPFLQDNQSLSQKGVLRGLHFQNPPFAQGKLVRVINGSVIDVAVDIRKNSKTYGKYFSHLLDCDNHESIFIPKGFAHGYLTLSKIALVHYQVDNYYNPKMESGIPFDDSLLNIDWGIKKSKLIISKKDSNHNPFIW